jgi:hypothetical protein
MATRSASLDKSEKERGVYHHKPTDLHAREQFDKLKEVFADHTGWNEDDTSVELNVGEQS